MRLWVTSCDGEGVLYSFDSRTGAAYIMGHGARTGIATKGRYLFTEHAGSLQCRDERFGRVLDEVPLYQYGIADIHDIHICRRNLYVVSTATSAVHQFKLKSCNPLLIEPRRTFIDPLARGHDATHLNCINVNSRDVMLLSAFADRPVEAFGYKSLPRNSGTLRMVSTDFNDPSNWYFVADGLFRPHSICATDSEFAVLEMDGVIRKGEIGKPLECWCDLRRFSVWDRDWLARGMTGDAESGAFVGLSADRGSPKGSATILHIDPDGRMSKAWSIPSREIYAIVPEEPPHSMGIDSDPARQTLVVVNVDRYAGIEDIAAELVVAVGPIPPDFARRVGCGVVVNVTDPGVKHDDGAITVDYGLADGLAEVVDNGAINPDVVFFGASARSKSDPMGDGSDFASLVLTAASAWPFARLAGSGGPPVLDLVKRALVMGRSETKTFGDCWMVA